MLAGKFPPDFFMIQRFPFVMSFFGCIFYVFDCYKSPWKPLQRATLYYGHKRDHLNSGLTNEWHLQHVSAVMLQFSF